MLTQILFTLAVASTQAPDFSCPVTGEPAGKKFTVDYNGARFAPCCAGCAKPMLKDPAATLASDKVKGKTVGVFLFDPVSRKRIDAKKAKATSDFGGIRFPFESAANKAAFDADPKKYGTLPAKEALYCAVMGHPIKSHADAGAYADYEGVRYYVCCPGCLGKLETDAKSVVGKAASAVRAPVASQGKG